MDKTLVTAKVNPDLDGTACALSYADLLNKLGGHAEAVMFGQPQLETDFFVENKGIIIPTHEDDNKGDWVYLVLVDSSSMKGMPQVVQADKVREIIDHRPGQPDKEFPRKQIMPKLDQLLSH